MDSIIVKTLHIDSYKFHTVYSHHIVHVGGWHVLGPECWGFNIKLLYTYRIMVRYAKVILLHCIHDLFVICIHTFM